jgi:hypothetical protein
MGFFDALFGSSDDVPDTIGDEEAARLKDAGARRPWFTKEERDRRVAETEQQQKRWWS